MEELIELSTRVGCLTLGWKQLSPSISDSSHQLLRNLMRWGGCAALVICQMKLLKLVECTKFANFAPSFLIQNAIFRTTRQQENTCQRVCYFFFYIFSFFFMKSALQHNLLKIKSQKSNFSPFPQIGSQTAWFFLSDAYVFFFTFSWTKMYLNWLVTRMNGRKKINK